MLRHASKIAAIALLASSFNVAAVPATSPTVETSAASTSWAPTKWCPPYMPKQFCPA
ncbi:MAG TPA: hypothetical protein VGE16_00840 [Albitalea sp.]